MDIFAILFYQPIYNILIILYNLVGQNLGLAIIAIAVIFRFVTIPITIRQIKMGKDSQELQEKIKDLKDLYKNNKKKLQEEQLKLQQEYLPGQISGCLPMILQLIMLSQIYIVLSNIFSQGAQSFNEVAYGFMPKFAEGATLNNDFFGIDLSKSAGMVGYEDLEAVLPYVFLAVLVAATQFLSTRIIMGMRAKKDDKEEKPKKIEKKKDEKESPKPEDFAEIMQRSTKQTMFILPLMIGFMALNFPAGLAIYWTAQSGFVIIQQFIVEKLRNKDE